MRYVPYHRLDGRPNVIVDGSPTAGTVLTVTHWPGYPPPDAIADDLSAQMALRLLDRRDLVPDGVEAVSNNHFDQDGLVAAYALTDPDGARERRAFLTDVASAGDFARSGDRDAARVSMLISAFAAGAVGTIGHLPSDDDERTAVLYAEMLGRLPELCDHPDRHRELWADEDATLSASEAAIATGGVSVDEVAAVDLAVLTVGVDAPGAGGHRFGGNWSDGLHPMAVTAVTDRLVVATRRGRDYVVEQRYESWVQLRSRPLRLRRDLVPLAARLQADEGGDAAWTATPVGSLIPRLASNGESSIDPERFVAVLVDHLATAPPAWDPFAPRR